MNKRILCHVGSGTGAILFYFVLVPAVALTLPLRWIQWVQSLPAWTCWLLAILAIFILPASLWTAYRYLYGRCRLRLIDSETL